MRIGWALTALAGGIGIVAYLLGMYFFPREGAEEPPGETAPESRVELNLEPQAEEEAGPAPESRVPGPMGQLIAGVALFVIGVLIALRAIGVLRYGFWGAWDITWKILWPVSLIAGGLFFLYIYWRRDAQGYARFRRLGWDKLVLGVCSGLGEYFRLDPNIVRFAFGLLIILTRGIGLVVYVLIGLLTPEAKDEAEVT